MNLQKRLGPAAAPLVGPALHEASWILPRINATDFPYKFFPMTRGWAEKQRWGELPNGNMPEDLGGQRYAAIPMGVDQDIRA